MDIEAFIPERPVEYFDVRIVGGFAGPGEVDPDTIVVSPEIDQATGKFGAIVGKQIFGGSALPNQTVECLDHMFVTQTLSDFDRQRFAAEHMTTVNIRVFCPSRNLAASGQLLEPGIAIDMQDAAIGGEMGFRALGLAIGFWSREFHLESAEFQGST